MPFPKFFLISLIYASFFTLSYTQCRPDQKALLLQLKDELKFNSLNSKKLVQWNQTEECCNWYGVECDATGNVISLQLDDEGISAEIGNSSTLFRFKHLEKLNLAYNDFKNSQIPRGILGLTNLTHLNLSRAAFGGQFPVELSFLKKLVSLDISDFSWNIEHPNLEMFLRNLTGLRELYLDNIDISSQKSELGRIISSYLPDLRNLSLRYCGLSGPLDSSLSSLHYLSVLRLDGNDLSTPIPDFFVNFSSLITLSLYNCSLKGYFPSLIFQIPTLQNLDLSENQLLSGSIPDFPQGGSLKSLVLSKTNFSGSLPDSIGALRNLSKIDLSSCKFTGSIPATFANLTRLIDVDLSDNLFVGSLSSSLFEALYNLVSLNLSFNSFTGSIPQSLFGLPSLRKLWLKRNQFIGQIEESPIVNASNIVQIDLSSNQLEGPIPNSLLQLQSLGSLDLSHNSFNGTLQLEKILLPNLEALDLSFNKLSVRGNVNSSSSGFPKLRMLSLASCNLFEFPEFIKNSTIYELDLSNNMIAGDIPSWIWEIGNGAVYSLNFSSNLLTGMQKPNRVPFVLSTLDLRSNQLHGEIYLPIFMQTPIPIVLPPPNNGFVASSTSSMLFFLSLANNSLSGSIPTSLCNATILGVIDLSFNQLSGNIPPCLLENMGNLRVLNLGRNHFTGHIPDKFPVGCILQSLDINSNTVEGNLPKSITNCNALEFLDVGNNRINDSFPCMLSSILRVIVLRNNSFHGEVRCHKSWPNLQIVDISSNNFSGGLKSVNLSSWRAMVLESDAKLRFNRSITPYLQPSTSTIYYPTGVSLTVKGRELDIEKIWPDFVAVDISSNYFHGEIPDEIGDLTSLRLLNLSHNALNGSIAKSFGKLGVLESLDLSQNQLTGTIPVELAGLNFLSNLNLSYNKLVGKIPNGNQFNTFTVDSFKGNPGLCVNISCSGDSDGDGSSPPEHETVQSKKEIEWEYISAAAGFVVGLGSIVWLLVCHRRFRETYYDKIEDVVEERLYGMSKGRRRARRLVRTQGRR